jgi:hypothetical protein
VAQQCRFRLKGAADDPVSIGGDVLLTRADRQRHKILIYNLTTGQPLTLTDPLRTANPTAAQNAHSNHPPRLATLTPKPSTTAPASPDRPLSVVVCEILPLRNPKLKRS